MPDNTLNETRIRDLLSDFYSNQNECGFAAFVVMKNEPKLKQMSLSEIENEEGNTFRDVLKAMVFSVINDCFLTPEAEYVDGTRLADKQQKNLIINQSGTFIPFYFLNNSDENIIFSIEDLANACGVAFKIRKENKTIWCYQHLWSIMIPNRKKNSIMTRLNKFENQIVFEEQKDDLLTISRKIDILIIDGCLITSNTNLLQKNFGFQDYIYQSAEQAIGSITETNLVANSEKLREYIRRGKPKYAKKMMRIGTSRVLSLSAQELLNRINTLSRWNGKFVIDEKTDKIVLTTFKEVENLIDLFDERFTRSDITNTEYDTDVKTIAQPV